nr:MAG: replication associated protein [Cressdnaviricota sp.]
MGHRAYCFTLNNPTEQELDHLKNVIPGCCRYGVFQLERGESGTLHVQGYLSFRGQKTLSAVRNQLSERAHWESARGTALQNEAYCTKEDCREPGTVVFRHGEPPRQGRRTDLEPVYAAVLAKRPFSEIAATFPEEYVKHHRGLEALSSVLIEPRRFKTEVFWFFGPTGTGKSRKASELAPDAYYKMGTNKWWDGYCGHEDVIIDDYRRDLCTFSELLRLFDRYPMPVEVKGGTTQFVARRLFVTSPKSPSDTWDGQTAEYLTQLTRRIEHVFEFPLGVEHLGRFEDLFRAEAAPEIRVIDDNVELDALDLFDMSFEL